MLASLPTKFNIHSPALQFAAYFLAAHQAIHIHLHDGPLTCGQGEIWLRIRWARHYFCLVEFVLLPKTNVSWAPFHLACQTASLRGYLERLHIIYNRHKKPGKNRVGVMLKRGTMKTQAEPLINSIFPLLPDERLCSGIDINSGQGYEAFQNYEL